MRRARVLVADDHDAMLKKVVCLLKSKFDIVGTAADGRAALDAAEALQPDVLVLDITMPILTGIETARELKNRGSHVKIVFLTIHNDQEFARLALSTGALGYVVKPNVATDLPLAIRAALKGQSFISPSLPLESTR